MNESLRYEKADGVATATKTNAKFMQGMTREVLVGLRRAIEDARDDRQIRVLVITAANDGFHDGGRFVDELRPDTHAFEPLEYRELLQLGNAVIRGIETLEKPVIGVARGGARGGGFEMLHACDFVIAGEDATFSQPEIVYGLMTGWGGSQRVPRMVHWRRAKELLLLGHEISGREAAAMGLITLAVPRERIDGEVASLIARLKKTSAISQALTKQAMNKVWDTNLMTGLDYETEAHAALSHYGEFPSMMKAWSAGEEPGYILPERVTAGPEWK